MHESIGNSLALPKYKWRIIGLTRYDDFKELICYEFCKRH
jgi:hypothetical protein